jgi:very-short-patch-repair endonuclease
MDPMTSLYELGGMIYPSDTLMLREHFRCVEPIMRFSSQFYDYPLVPLRIPMENERLDPPLIDIYVPHGRRNKSRKVNKAEAEVIVDQIKSFVSDPLNSKRSIGVISLIGHDQSKVIYDMLVDELGTETVERHHILCGDSATFQGQERDVVYLSMVSCPATTTSLTARRYAQRFNVAMSRARDRIVLVRSVAASHLKEGDLKLKVIEHMRNPMAEANVVRPNGVLEQCESEFERDFARRMLALGYRLRAQVPVAGRRIDFVIEGAENARLAIELDGDKWHGPERWAEDIHRQKSLERMGWKFWRCWGSNWVSDKEGCISDLIATLGEMRIQPLGAAAVAGTFTQHITIEPPPAEPGKPVLPDIESLIDSVNASITPSAVGSKDKLSTSETIRQPHQAEEVPDDVVEIGDLVVICYNDNPGKPERWRITDRESDFDQRRLNSQQPLAAALLGRSVEDEVTIKVGDRERIVVIERIEKPADVAA